MRLYFVARIAPEMTRINIIDPTLLADQHLVAEYRETTMVPASLKRTLVSARGYSVDRIPKRFTLNTGHVTFFYNKLRYLENRYECLVEELMNRGYRPDLTRVMDFTGIPEECFGDWTPSKGEQLIVIDRITTRLRQRRGWYRYGGEVVDVERLIEGMERYVD